MTTFRVAAAAAVALLVCPGFMRAELPDANDHIVVDGVTLRFGDTVEVSGPCEDRSQGLQFGAASIRAVRINKKPTQEAIHFHLCPNHDNQAPTFEALLNLEPPSHYLVRGKLTNARINGLNNICLLITTHFEKIPPAELRVADFVDREAMFEGLAAAGGKLKCGDETIGIQGIKAWPKDVDGLHVAVRGVVRKRDGSLQFERPTWKLYRLDELVNRPVILEGVLASTNDHWWFEYRDQELYLTSAAGPVLRFSSDNYHQRVRVSGELVLQTRPSLDQISEKQARDLVPTYVIRSAKVEPIGKKVAWEQQFGTVYRSRHQSRDGVPELRAESSFRRNLVGNETKAQLYIERNIEVIREVLRNADDRRCEVLARRITDERVDQVLRLIYASMLANIGDKRGSEYLLASVADHARHLDLNALYALTVVPFLDPDQDRQIPVAWAEQPLIALLKDDRQVTISGAVWSGALRQGKYPIARAAVQFSEIAATLREIGSDDCRQALFNYLKKREPESERFAAELCRWKPRLAEADLLAIDKLVDDRGIHRTVLRLLLAQKSPDVVRHYQKDLKDGFVYMDFRDHLSPEIIAQLKQQLPQLTGFAKEHALMLLALGQQDAVAELLNMLRDPNWPDKNLVLFELARFGDRRAVVPVALFLRTAPKEGVRAEEGLSPTNTVIHGLEAIAHAGTAEAIRELVELLPVDLSRFGGYIKREEWPLIVAAHLIELTGESYGTNVDQWRAWQTAHAEHSVPRELANPRGGFRTGPGAAIDLGR